MQGMFSFALDIPKPEETRPALVHIFALLNPEYARQGVMTHAVGTIIRTFGDLVCAALGDRLTTAVMSITHQNNPATEHMAQKIADGLPVWKDIEAFGSKRRKRDILFAAAYDAAKTWGLESATGEVTASAE